MPKGRFLNYRSASFFAHTARFFGLTAVLLASSFSMTYAQTSASVGAAGGADDIIQAQNLAGTPVSSLNNQQLAQILGNVPLSSLSPQALQALGIGSLQGLDLGNLGLGGLGTTTLNDLGINLSGLPLNNILGGLGGNISGLLNPGGIGNLVGVGVPGLGGLGGEQPTILPSAAIAATLRGRCVTPSCAAGHHGRTINELENHFRNKRHNLEDWMRDDLYETEILPALQAMAEQWNAGDADIGVQASIAEDAVAQVQTGNVVSANQARIANNTAIDDGLCRMMENREAVPQVALRTRTKSSSLFQTVNANLNGAPGSLASQGAVNQSLAVLEDMQSRYCNSAELDGALDGVLGFTCDTVLVGADTNFDAAASSGDEGAMTAFVRNAMDMTAPTTFTETMATLPDVLDYQSMRRSVDQYSAISADSLVQNLSLSMGTGTPIPASLQTMASQSGLGADALAGILETGDMSQLGYMQLQALTGAAAAPTIESVSVNGAGLERRSAQFAGSETIFLVNLNEAMRRETRNISALAGYLTRLRTENANALMLRVSDTETGTVR